jgi:HD-GYP domain-containing protein (c-di-GMP phosphodiesterase class II)
MSHAEASGIIYEGRDKNFDGRVVDVFEDMNEALAAAAKKP